MYIVVVKGKRLRANETITVFPRSQLEASVIDAIVNHILLYTTKKGEHLFAGGRGSNPQAAIQKGVLKKNMVSERCLKRYLVK